MSDETAYKFPLDGLWEVLDNNKGIDRFKTVFDDWMNQYFDWFSVSGIVCDLIEKKTRPNRIEMILYVLSKTGYEYGHDDKGIPEPIRWVRYDNDQTLEDMIKKLEPPKKTPVTIFHKNTF